MSTDTSFHDIALPRRKPYHHPSTRLDSSWHTYQAPTSPRSTNHPTTERRRVYSPLLGHHNIYGPGSCAFRAFRAAQSGRRDTTGKNNPPINLNHDRSTTSRRRPSVLSCLSLILQALTDKARPRLARHGQLACRGTVGALSPTIFLLLPAMTLLCHTHRDTHRT